MLNRLNALQSQSTCVGLLVRRNLRRQKPPPGKPPILPPAKRTLYNVDQPEWERPDHVEELLWRRHVYNNAMESLREVFAQELLQKKQEGLIIEDLRKQELEELDMLLAKNERRNQEAAEERRIRNEQEVEIIKKNIADDIEAQLEKEHLRLDQKTQEVKQAIERSSNFITFENLDERLNQVLEEPVVFDYAIDLNGTKFYDPAPVKYQTGIPTRQKGRLYDRTLALSNNKI